MARTVGLLVALRMAWAVSTILPTVFLGVVVAVPPLAAALVPLERLYVRDVVGEPITRPGQSDDDDAAGTRDAGGRADHDTAGSRPPGEEDTRASTTSR